MSYNTIEIFYLNFIQYISLNISSTWANTFLSSTLIEVFTKLLEWVECFQPEIFSLDSIFVKKVFKLLVYTSVSNIADML